VIQGTDYNKINLRSTYCVMNLKTNLR
jgi:hypothetical protein